MSPNGSREAPPQVYDPLADYRRLDEQIDSAQGTADAAYDRAMELRWTFGQKLAAERVDGRLPNGRRDEVATAIGKSPAEVGHRMRFFDRYPTEEERASALAHRPPWREVIQSLTRDPRPPATSNGDGGAQVLPSTLVEAGLTHQRNQDALTLRRQEYDDDIQRHGPNPLSPPISAEAERLRHALRVMEGGAEEIRKLDELDELIPLARVIAELPPAAVRRQLRKIRNAYNAAHLAFIASKPIDLPGPSDVLELETDPDADIEGFATPLPLDGGENPAGVEEAPPGAVVYEPEPGGTVAFDEDAEAD